MNNGQIFGTPASATATGTTGATANIVVGANQTAYITDAGVSGDGVPVLIIYDNTTVKWQQSLAGTTPYVLGLVTPIKATMGNTLSVVVTGTTNNAKANISGYISNNS